MLAEHGVTTVRSTYYEWLAYPIAPAQQEEAYLVNRIVQLGTPH